MPDTAVVKAATPVARRVTFCTDCGWELHLWYSPNHSDPGDVDPRATCTNPECEGGY